MKSKKLFFTLFVAVFMAAALLFLFVGNVANVYASQTQESINWNMKDIWQNKTSRDVPAFGYYDLMVECGPRAGLTALGFYDYEYPELLTGDVYEGTYVATDEYYDFYDEYKRLDKILPRYVFGTGRRHRIYKTNGKCCPLPILCSHMGRRFKTVKKNEASAKQISPRSRI